MLPVRIYHQGGYNNFFFRHIEHISLDMWVIAIARAIVIPVQMYFCVRKYEFPSEKAWAYKMKTDALNRQGKRTDLTSRPLVGKLESADKIGAENNESGRQIQRYISLTELKSGTLKTTKKAFVRED